jgi:cytochrome c556
MRPFLLALIVLSTAAGAAEGGQKAAPTAKKKVPAAKKGLETPSYLSPIARQLLKQRMARHGGDTLALVRAVLFLDHETTQRLAAEIAAEPRLTRPIAGGADDINAALPERFFVLQDELRSRALDLAQAARGPDHEKLAARLGELTQTCVSCHATYLEPPLQLAP